MLGAGSAIYKDSELTPDGISHIKLKLNLSKGESKIVLKARGENLRLPGTPVALPLTAMLRRSDDGSKCWAATFYDWCPSKNADGEFKSN